MMGAPLSGGDGAKTKACQLVKILARRVWWIEKVPGGKTFKKKGM